MGKRARSTRQRTTIGLLASYIRESGYQAIGWRGVADAAEAQEANLICFLGGGLGVNLPLARPRNMAYHLAHADNVDGLILMGGALGEFIGPRALLRFCQRYQSLPIVNIAMALPGIPSVLVDNTAGMQQAISHLIEVHGLRRIAFVRGPRTNPEAEERYQAYCQTLTDHGIPLDPQLVAQGDFLMASGIEAVRLFFEERHLRPEAIVAANDDMAFGILQALRERGLNVPEEVSVTGFDDVPEASFASPPLTTIRQPLYEQGKLATELLFARLAGLTVPEVTTLPARLVTRRSCRCTPYFLPAFLQDSSISNSLEQERSILAALTTTAGNLHALLPANWAADLLGSSIAALKSGQNDKFLRLWDTLLQQTIAQNGLQEITVWSQILTLLCSYLRLSMPDEVNRSDLWFQAQGMVSEAVHWAHGHRRIQTEREGFEFITNISEPLMTAFDLDTLTEVLAETLPQFHIAECYLALYEQPLPGQHTTPHRHSYLALAYRDGRRHREWEGVRFPTRQLLPPGVYAPQEHFSLLLEPLHFRGERHFGYILFGPLRAAARLLREALTRQICTALQGAFLSQERQQAEARLQFEHTLLRSILDHSPDLIWFTDREGHYVETSASHARYLGAAPEAIIGKTLFDFYPEDTARRWLEHEKRIIESEMPMIGKEEKIKSPVTGEEHWVSTTKIPWYDEKGRVLGTLGIARDIGELKRAQEALKEYAERLEAMVEERTQALQEALRRAQEADRLKSEFIANINHELRTPLSNLLLYSQMMYSQPASRTQKNLEIIQRELQRLRHLIEELLNLSRLDSGQMVFHPQSTDFNHLVASIVHDRATLAAERSLTIHTDLDVNLPPVWVDEFMLTQAISNLLLNALNYTPPGGTIWVRTRREHRQGQAGLLFSVQDSGPGILPEDLPHIFERFYRGRAGRESGASGTGLGLAIVQRVIELHQGKVEVANAEDGGAIFSIWLPIAPHEIDA